MRFSKHHRLAVWRRGDVLVHPQVGHDGLVNLVGVGVVPLDEIAHRAPEIRLNRVVGHAVHRRGSPTKCASGVTEYLDGRALVF